MYRRNLGDQIRDIVEDAVDSCNFNDLNNKIKNTADRAIDEFNRATESFQYDNRGRRKPHRYQDQGAVPPFMGGMGGGPNGQPGPGPNGFGGNQGGPQYGGSQFGGQGYRPGADRYQRMASQWKVRPPYQKKQRKAGVPGTVSSVLFIVFGAISSVGFGITALVLFTVWMASGGWNFVLPTLGSIFLAVTAVSAGIVSIGVNQKKRIRRYNEYDEIVGPNNYCEIKRLAEKSGKTEKYIVKDLQKMIQLGFFREGHIDEAKTCFMLNDQTYQQYLEALNNYKERELEEEKKRQEEEGQDPELKKAIEAGNAYIKQINLANEDIPGEEISKKLYLLEDIVSKIFVCVQKHPNKLPEIRKFMEYYLPITLKLVNAYKEFDSQPIQGDNIKKSKQEIEDTIDTINTAFEKLLDSLYEDEAMEVASDISVLNTLFAQEGLTKKDFNLK